MVTSPSADVPVLTTPGRRVLSSRLTSEIEALRRLAEQHGRDGTEPGDEYRQLASQVTRLRDLLEVAVEPTRVPDDPQVVELGDEVVVRDDNGELDTFVLTDPVEAALLEGNASVSSPLGQALVGRRAGERVSVQAPNGTWAATIVSRKRAS